MTDAWIMATDQELAGETAGIVAKLGLTPRRVASNGDGRPVVEDGGAERLPEVVIVIAAQDEPTPSRLCARLREGEGLAAVPLVLALAEHHLHSPPDASVSHELIVRPYTELELRTRIARARAAQQGVDADELIRAGALVVNLATYQVTVGDQPMDFTYMEYELLKFLIMHPRRVFSREALLSSVWGYDYYGGARTVDVHIRRLRAKLGQEHGGRIKTVRGVGYKLEL